MMPDKNPPFTVGNIAVDGDLILSPMDGFSDSPFRSLCRRMGSSMSYTEFMRDKDILERPEHVEKKLAYREEQRPVVYQIYGYDDDRLLEAALCIQERGPDAIDINMGCPNSAIVQRGAGAGMMRHPFTVARTFRKLTTHLEIPVTAKIRLGWEDCRNYMLISRIVEENGGVRSVADIERMKEHTGCDGVMIGRAARGNPWIFSRRDRREVPPGEVQRVMFAHLDASLKFYGEPWGLILFRKFAAEYLKPYKLGERTREDLLTLEDPDIFKTQLAEILKRQRSPG